MEIEPRHFGALSGLAMIEMRFENYEAALKAYEAAAEVNPHLEEVNIMIEKLTEKLRGIAL